MDWQPPHHKIILQIIDSLTTVISFVVSYYLWQALRWLVLPGKLGGDISFDPAIILILLFLAVMWSIILDMQGAYSYQRFTSFKKEVGMIFRTVCFGLVLLFGLVFVLRPGYIPRTLCSFSVE